MLHKEIKDINYFSSLVTREYEEILNATRNLLPEMRQYIEDEIQFAIRMEY